MRIARVALLSSGDECEDGAGVGMMQGLAASLMEDAKLLRRQL